MVNKYNLYDIMLPRGSEVVINIDPSVQVGTEFSSKQTPGLSGYKFSISYFKLIVPGGVLANIIVETDKGSTTLLASNVSNDTIIIDASDFNGLDYLNSFTLYAQVAEQLATTTNVVLEYGGKIVVPYVG